MTEPATSLGFTLSPRQTEYLALDWGETVKAAMGLSPGLVRLGAYWSEIEVEPGRYDFSALDAALHEVRYPDRQIILTVGMKAPRWPEYYVPVWRQQTQVVSFTAAVVSRYGHNDLVDYWQVENEPFDPSGEHRWRISEELLKEEIALLRRLDRRQRPIIATMWVKTHPLARLDVGQRLRARRLLSLVDVLGLDVYPSVGQRVMGKNVYVDWSHWYWEAAAARLRRLAERLGKQAWVMEAQAEPWEPGHLVHVDPKPSRSMRPETAVQICERLRRAGFRDILLWGVEHWWMRVVRHRDSTWWDAMGRLYRSRV